MTPLARALQSLPILGDDLYLRMQASNIGIVDEYLRQAEGELLALYMREERTPTPEAIFLSAQSQLWIFGLYELLRTWRQRANEVLDFADRLAATDSVERESWLEEQRSSLGSRSVSVPGIDAMEWRPYQGIVDDPTVADTLRLAFDSTELVFRRIESLRVHLAKHEVPKDKGSRAMAPGYGRIDMLSGSISWQVNLTQHEVDYVSRQSISDACLRVGEDLTRFILPTEIQDLVKPLPKMSYAAKCVTVTLRDGREFDDVFIAWNKQIFGVGAYEEQPFEAADIVAVRVRPEENAQ